MEVINMEQIVLAYAFVCLVMLIALISLIFYYHIKSKRNDRKIKKLVMDLYNGINRGEIYTLKRGCRDEDVLVVDKIIEEGLPFITYRAENSCVVEIMSAKQLLYSDKQFEYADLGE